MFPSICNFAPTNEPTTQPLTQRFPKSPKRHLSAFEQIQNRSHKLCCAYSMNSSHVALGEISGNAERARGGFHCSAESFSGRSCGASQALRPKGREDLEQFDDCRLPGHPPPDSWTRATKASGQGARLAERWLGDRFPDAHESSFPPERGTGEYSPRTPSFGLLCREEALLVFRDLVEPLRGLFASLSHDTILQLI